MYNFRWSSIISIFFLFSLYAQGSAEVGHHTVDLSHEEKSYLNKKKSIKMCVDPDWMPFEKINNGKHIGISSEYMKLLQSKIGIPFVLVPTASWTESILFMESRKCDILSLAMKTMKRKKFIDFTIPYLSSPLVVATKNDKFFIPNFHKLDNKTIGISRNHATNDLMKKKYPQIDFVEVESISDGLQQVADDKLFGYVDNITTIGYQINNNYSAKLRIVGKFDDNLILSVGVRNDHPALLNILNKAIETVDMVTRDQIINQWLLIKYDQQYSHYGFWYLSIPFILLALFLLVRQYILRKYNINLKNQVSNKVEELREKDELLLQRYRMAAMGEMLSMIAHQWRQPLGAISSAIMSIDVKLARGKFDLSKEDERREFMVYLEKKHTSINEYVNYLSATTDDFRNFFNPNRDKELIEITKPIIDALHILHKHLESNDIDVIVDFQTEDDSYMMYQNEIMQVIISIIRNAQEHFDTKEIEDPTITLKTYNHNEYHIISICDNGGGVPEDIINNIFEPYFSTKREKNGSGLGLYMSKVMIEDHHGSILSVSNRDGGACFKIKLSPNNDQDS